MANLNKVSIVFYSLGLYFLVRGLFWSQGSIEALLIPAVLFAAGYVVNRIVGEP
jgi:hypothetical protein